MYLSAQSENTKSSEKKQKHSEFKKTMRVAAGKLWKCDKPTRTESFSLILRSGVRKKFGKWQSLRAKAFPTRFKILALNSLVTTRTVPEFSFFVFTPSQFK